MAKSDVAVKETAAEVEAAEQAKALEAELAQENLDGVDSDDIQIPLLKIGQSNTVEVQDGDAAPGEFVNALTREGLGREIQFVVARMQKGRFDHGDRNATPPKRARKAYNTKTVPWNDDPFYGRPFSEHPDAQEKYSERVNAGEIEWGKGPRIATTWDFTGYVLDESAEDGEEPVWIPVCLSLERTNAQQAKKWVMLINAVLRGKAWDAVFELSTLRKEAKGNAYFGINVKQGRKTTVAEKQQAMNLAMNLRDASAVSVVGESDDPSARGPEPDSAGGMEV